MSRSTAFNYMIYVQSSIMLCFVAFPGQTHLLFVLTLHGNVKIMPNQLGVDFFHFM